MKKFEHIKAKFIKESLEEAERDTHFYEWNEENQSWDKKERE